MTLHGSFFRGGGEQSVQVSRGTVARPQSPEAPSQVPPPRGCSWAPSLGEAPDERDWAQDPGRRRTAPNPHCRVRPGQVLVDGRGAGEGDPWNPPILASSRGLGAGEDQGHRCPRRGQARATLFLGVRRGLLYWD